MASQQQPSFFPALDRQIADASLDAFAKLRPNLTQLEIDTFLRVCDYLTAHPHFTDVTGGELAAWANVDRTSCRPRLTGLKNKGWLIQRAGTRKSRVPKEWPCSPYVPAVPRDAITRRQGQA